MNVSTKVTTDLNNVSQVQVTVDKEGHSIDNIYFTSEPVTTQFILDCQIKAAQHHKNLTATIEEDTSTPIVETAPATTETKPAPKKRTRRTKEQIAADNAAKGATETTTTETVEVAVEPTPQWKIDALRTDVVKYVKGDVKTKPVLSNILDKYVSNWASDNALATPIGGVATKLQELGAAVMMTSGTVLPSFEELVKETLVTAGVTLKDQGTTAQI